MTRLLLSALSASMHFSIAAASSLGLPNGTEAPIYAAVSTVDQSGSRDLGAFGTDASPSDSEHTAALGSVENIQHTAALGSAAVGPA